MHGCVIENSVRIKIIPAKISAIKHKQLQYAFRNCKHESLSSKIITSPKPVHLISGSIASHEASAAVVTEKYCGALPLYRQVDIFERGGLSLWRGTLAIRCIKAELIIKPLILYQCHFTPHKPVPYANYQTLTSIKQKLLYSSEQQFSVKHTPL
jgi:transposase